MGQTFVLGIGEVRFEGFEARSAEIEAWDDLRRKVRLQSNETFADCLASMFDGLSGPMMSEDCSLALGSDVDVHRDRGVVGMQALCWKPGPSY